MAGVATGLGAAAFWVGGPLAFVTLFLGLLPLIAVGFSLGLKSAVIAAGTAGLIASLATGPVLGLVIILVQLLPALWIIRLGLLARPIDDVPGNSLEWYPIGHILMWLVGVAGLGLVVAALAFADQEHGLRGIVEAKSLEAIEILKTAGGNMASQDEEFLVQMVSKSAPMVPAVMSILWVVAQMVGAILGFGLVQRRGLSLRPSETWSGLWLPRWVVGLFAFSLALAVLTPGQMGFLAASLAALVALPFLLVGLAVAHVFVRTQANQSGFLIGGLYVGLLLFAQILAPVLVIVGLVEQWTGWRQRWLTES